MHGAVIIKCATGKLFKTIIGVRQGCLLSPTLFNIYLEEMMRVTLENYNGSVVIGGREICNIKFADDIDLIAGTLDELQLITNKLYISSAAYGMEIIQEKSKVMVNERYQVELPREITMGGKILEMVE